MESGASTPEELETLLEDACVMRDPSAFRALFEDGAVLAAGGGVGEARGTDQIAAAALALWEGRRSYVADPRLVVQARDTALMVGERGINVGRRGADGAWRFVIALLSFDDAIKEKQ